MTSQARSGGQSQDDHLCCGAREGKGVASDWFQQPIGLCSTDPVGCRREQRQAREKVGQTALDHRRGSDVSASLRHHWEEQQRAEARDGLHDGQEDEAKGGQTHDLAALEQRLCVSAGQ